MHGFYSMFLFLLQHTGLAYVCNVALFAMFASCQVIKGVDLDQCWARYSRRQGLSYILENLSQLYVKDGQTTLSNQIESSVTNAVLPSRSALADIGLIIRLLENLQLIRSTYADEENTEEKNHNNWKGLIFIPKMAISGPLLV